MEARDGSVGRDASNGGVGRDDEARNEDKLSPLNDAAAAFSGASPALNDSASYFPPKEAIVIFWEVVTMPVLSEKDNVSRTFRFAVEASWNVRTKEKHI